MDLCHYQNIISLTSGKSRKLRMSGTKTFLNATKAAKYKSRESPVSFLCAASRANIAKPTDDMTATSRERDERSKSIVLRNQTSNVNGYNGLFYRPNMQSFVEHSPLMTNTRKYFEILGKIMILAMKEDKRINLELHKMIFKLLLNGHDVSILDMLRVYPNDHYLMLLFRLFNIYKLYQHIETYSCVADSSGDISTLKRKCEAYLDLLCLTLSTPMYNVPLHTHKEEELHVANLERYLVGICNFFLNDGVRLSNSHLLSAMQSIQNGNTCIGDRLLLPFYDYELEMLVIGSNTQHFNEWTPKYLCKHTHLEQYTYSTPVVVNLFDILCNEFDMKQKRQFIRFLTGSLSLPIGGISKLNPKFTISKFATLEQQFLYEHTEYESLPHATTCRHILRLPPYKTKSTLQKKLIQAMSHAQTGFYLS
eukprot:CAMPEP_0197080738 /NCGR_PEP_ID=MMETSP1384-20130603/214285_1 /TAXON_ID=29189 /ORGANISM="Ammonia sp." /LENGTH=421 /DNA_ID=CAMNT_0042519629 /DNA_START=441 /DNA_END=1706 /DNA_ORIENTATION=-